MGGNTSTSSRFIPNSGATVAAANSPDRSASRKSMFTEVPDEILDMIVRKLWTIHRAQHSSVCRRWYRLTLPYLWRCIRIFLIGQKSPMTILDDFLSLMASRPELAVLVQRLVLYHIEGDVSIISRALELLPNLRFLILRAPRIHPADGDVLTRHASRHALEQLMITGARGTNVFIPATVQLLSLFYEIRRITLKWNGIELENDAVDRTIPKDALDNLHVFQLDMNLDTSSSFYLNILGRHGAFRHLAYLRVEANCLEALVNLSQLLSTVGPTLRELFLRLCWDLSTDGFRLTWDQDTAAIDSALRREFVVTSIRKGIESCSALHGFRLAMSTSFPYNVAYDASVVQEIAAQGWLMGVAIINLVTTRLSQQLRHLSFNYWTTGVDPSEYDRRLFSWSKLREACRRCIDLRILHVQFLRRYKDNAVGRVKLWGKECVQQEMRDFHDALRRGEAIRFGECEEESCRLYVGTA
ncbi:hypothetical protein BDY19DRAFT_660196 [Irpex rosettiformis]|uniref:Uncharacterized protein n=1 Tax=Irpex rosettiformis TaxID=378272 RepID=A0ACB8TNA3_9APHY|nr:hypothetical protein BDY19DRAFT_660196 [Irpex rosettiformis]